MNEFEFMYFEVVEVVGKLCIIIMNLLCLNNFNDDVKLLVEYGDIEMGYVCVLLVFDGEV